MRWTVHGEETLYESSWVRVHLADVELPNGHRFGHHLVRVPAPVAGVVVGDPQRGVLLLWRHRFITDSWGWEIPAGRVEPGEPIEVGAAREVFEETGWRPGPLRQLTRYHPSTGLSDQTFHLFVAHRATWEGPPVDWFEAEKVEWVSRSEVRSALADGKVSDGLSLTALSWCLAFGEL